MAPSASSLAQRQPRGIGESTRPILPYRIVCTCPLLPQNHVGTYLTIVTTIQTSRQVGANVLGKSTTTESESLKGSRFLCHCATESAVRVSMVAVRIINLIFSCPESVVYQVVLSYIFIYFLLCMTVCVLLITSTCHIQTTKCDTIKQLETSQH